VPLLHPKKGGGLRVKRILMYDEGSATNEKPHLYGTEYEYNEGATQNEPNLVREENALITFMPRKNEQNWLQKVVSGIDLEEGEGPLGETILPLGGVGYHNVIARNIYTSDPDPSKRLTEPHPNAPSGGGYTVYDYYTCKDYPFDRKYPELGKDMKGVMNTILDDQTKDKFGPRFFTNILITRTRLHLKAIQAYSFLKNSMHGRPLSISTYSEPKAYQNTTPNATNSSTSTLSTSTTYEYFEHYKILPEIHDWHTDQERIKDGKLVYHIINEPIGNLIGINNFNIIAVNYFTYKYACISRIVPKKFALLVLMSASLS
jgi:hypothetical protein